MRTAKVPIDMSSEQKEILGLLSKRQLTYLAVGGLLLYYYIPIVYSFVQGLTGSWTIGVITSLFAASPTAAIIFFLGFVKVEKFNMNRDYYYWIVIQRKTQYGSWRKGPPVE